MVLLALGIGVITKKTLKISAHLRLTISPRKGSFPKTATFRTAAAAAKRVVCYMLYLKYVCPSAGPICNASLAPATVSDKHANRWEESRVCGSWFCSCPGHEVLSRGGWHQRTRWLWHKGIEGSEQNACSFCVEPFWKSCLKNLKKQSDGDFGVLFMLDRTAALSDVMKATK